MRIDKRQRLDFTTQLGRATPAVQEQRVGERRDFAPARRAMVAFPDLDAQRRVFARTNGKQQNLLVVAPEAQAHIVLENYAEHAAKRMVTIAQQSGNVAGGMWWSSASATALSASDPEVVRDGSLVGVGVRIAADAKGSVTFEPPLLDSVRALRDRATLGTDDRTTVRAKAHALGLGVNENAIATRCVSSSPTRVIFERESVARTIEGKAQHLHRMVIEASSDTVLAVDAAGHVRMSSAGKPRVTISYLTDLPSLTPYKPLELLNEHARTALQTSLKRAAGGLARHGSVAQIESAVRALEDLSSLVFHEKTLAGGWRFLTYFGRDTLQTMQMLRPILDTKVVERVLEAALERLSPNGEVAHEESIRDQAAHERLEHAIASGSPAKLDMQRIEDPIYDYKMVDDDFMLVSVLAEHLLDPKVDAAAKAEFLVRNRQAVENVVKTVVTRGGPANTVRVDQAIRYIESQARPYAENPGDPTKLVKLKDGSDVGEWRDSSPGVAFGRHPSSVDLELVPTSLDKGAKLAKALGLDVGELRAQADAWYNARDHFTVSFSQDELRDRLRWFMRSAATPEERAYFGSIEVEPGVTFENFIDGKALRGPLARGLSFPAVALDATGKPIPVMTSDGLFGLLGSDARPEAVESICTLLTTPYPLGLATDAGVLITNAALTKDAHLYDIMGPGRYHGTLVWTWLEALAISALSHQGARLEEEGHYQLAARARKTVRTVEKLASRGGELQTSELYGYAIIDGAIKAVPFKGAANEPYDSWPGNGTQLWATALPLLKWARANILLG